tara:strand:+ start:851 stop:2128 length:1278 start_codon:yes stop_codon:yes gene_type:complete
MEKFIKKTSEEVTALNDEQKSQYLADLIKWQTKSIEDLQIASKKEDANNEEISKQIKSLTDASITSLKTSLEAQGGAIAKLSKELEAKESTVPANFTQAVLKSLDTNKDDIQEMLKSGSKNIRLEIKASQGAGDITTGTDFAEMEAGVGQIATRQTFMRSLFVNKNTSKEYVKYNDQETVVRDAKNVAACAASTHLSKLTWQVRTLQITKIRDFVDVCTDMMDDYDFVEGEIRELVNTDVALKVDSDLLISDGIYPNPNSVANVASTFAAGSYATSVQTPTLIDLIKVASSQISDFGQNNKFSANVVLINPIDATLMTLEKDLNNNYMMPNWITNDGVNIGSVKVMTNQLVPVNEMYIMDSTKGTVYSRKGVTVELGFENNDNFEKEIVTVKAYERLNLRVRNVDANAFMHVPSISAAITAITKP